MSYPHDHHDEDVLAGKDHELTLSTAAIFGIFFGLVVLCGIFFGFGYTLRGHGSAGSLPSESSSPSSTANFNAFKPAAGQPIGTHLDAPASAPSPAPKPAPVAYPETTSTDTASTPVPTHAVTAPATPPPASPPTTVPAGNFQVQVAAISINHPDDANLLLNALRAKGYTISAHPGPDTFIHLLIGPFTTRAAADAMRQRLLTDGYTAYIK